MPYAPLSGLPYAHPPVLPYAHPARVPRAAHDAGGSVPTSHMEKN